jgi:flagellar assembly protein FliH
MSNELPWKRWTPDDLALLSEFTPAVIDRGATRTSSSPS